MIRTIKRVFLASISVLGVSLLVWVLVALNPNWVYAHETKVDFVTIYHDDALRAEADGIVRSALEIIKSSDLYNEDISIDLCLNDNRFYPKIHPLVGAPLAYAMLDKTVLSNCKINFAENRVETQWSANNYELRKFDLTWLLAHEMTHNLQNNVDFLYVLKTAFGSINWKLEGHAEYVSRAYKDDGKLKERIAKLKVEEGKEHIGFPVMKLEDGTMQILSYLKYAIAIQYMHEVENLDYTQICNDQRSLDDIFLEIHAWHKT